MSTQLLVKILDDISKGVESKPLPVFAPLGDTTPPIPTFAYTNNVMLPANEMFVSKPRRRGCECVDNCSATDQCQCVPVNKGQLPPFDSDGLLKPDYMRSQPGGSIINECHENCKCNPSCPLRQTQRGNQFAFYLKWCGDAKGWGLFSEQNIAAGSYLINYSGALVHKNQIQPDTEDSYLYGLYPMLDSELLVDAFKYGNASRFINHSCQPNTVVVRVRTSYEEPWFRRICFFACCDINAHDELTVDYSDFFWQSKRHLRCMCRSVQCRYAKLPRLTNASL